MRGLRRLLILLILILIAATATFFVMRSARGEQIGPPTALCPGPDGYGYACAEDAVLEYVDATNDTLLYDDDGLTLLQLPFSFTFYGMSYDQVWASSNGNLQFSAANESYENVCLFPQPAPGMGEMIAPYWDDLSLTFSGYLETEVVGQSPERVFVVEWEDVPRYGTTEDVVTFEVQLLEGSNDIVFLYRDVRTEVGANGSQATIGLQSEALGYSLQVSCDQYAVQNGRAVHFVYPADVAIQEAGGARPARTSDQVEPAAPATGSAKGPGGELMEALNTRGLRAIDALKLAWLSERPALASQWRWADLDGDGEQELVILWHGDASRPELAELAVAGQEADGQWRMRWQSWPLARQERLRSLALIDQGDLTGDDADEVIVRDALGGGTVVLMKTADGYTLLELPGRCSGSLTLRDIDGDGDQEIIRGGCSGGQRWTTEWNGRAFVVSGGR
jgi:hypothetical protein